MACQRKCTENVLSTDVRVSEGESLLHVIKVRGAKGIFAWVWVDKNQKKTTIFSEADWPTAQEIYQREWPLPTDPKPDDGEYVTGFSFVIAESYEYELTLKRKNGTSQTLKKCTYGKEKPEDSCFEPLTIRVK